jgi:AmiR/NasT family two-component response regulator
MNPPLLFDLTDAVDSDWRAALEAAGLHRGAASPGDNLVQRTIAEAPELIICLAHEWTPALEAALAPWGGVAPCALLLLTPGAPPGADAVARAVELGVHHWAAPATADDLAPACASARARWRRETLLRDALVQAREQMEERKWVDRAKGVLMAGRGMAEDDAFRLLRGAAMNVNLRVGEISKAVFEAAQWADAMNRAGQLRMLSQRCVRLVAQRLLKMDVRACAALLQQSSQRVQDNLGTLARQCDATAAQAACELAARRWAALAGELAAPRIDQAALLRIDARADELLVAAEQLTDALQVAAGRRALHIVNECGRQRMRVQRVAKESLLATLPHSDAEGTALARRRDAALDEFETAQRALEQAPLNSPEIRATQAQLREEWLRLLAGLRAHETPDGRRALVHASETMLERLDALTAAYEHSLQVIMG